MAYQVTEIVKRCENANEIEHLGELQCKVDN